jgi:tRNA threonylcarbamoyladenosine biosynthesis protein TsaB
LAHGLNKKIIPVPTLDALAYNLIGSSVPVVPIMDARRNQVYTAVYDTVDGIDRISEYMACDIKDLLDYVDSIADSAIFLGDGVPVFKDVISAYSKHFTFAPVSCNMQRAACVGALALENTDTAVDCNDFEIIYLRKSQAEREREEKLNSSGLV